LLAQNLFAFYLTYEKDESKGLKSDLTFGYYDKEKFTGEMHWIPIEYKYMFGVNFEDIKINGKSTNVCQNQECLVTFDSGTSLMSVPIYAAASLEKQGYPTQDKKVPCKNKEQFGELTYVIHGKDYTIPNNEWVEVAKKNSLT
jgi:saccharopepsin